MDPKATARHCSHLLKTRAENFQAGGVGLLMDSGLGRSERVRKLTLCHRLRRGALVGVMAVGCMASGFASAKLWDMRGTSDLDLQFASDVAFDEDLPLNARKNGLGRVAFFATRAVEHLAFAEGQGELGRDAEIYLARLKRFLPDPSSANFYVKVAEDRSLTLEERQAALKKTYFFAYNSLMALARAAQDPDLSVAAAQFLKFAARAIPAAPPGIPAASDESRG